MCEDQNQLISSFHIWPTFITPFNCLLITDLRSDATSQSEMSNYCSDLSHCISGLLIGTFLVIYRQIRLQIYGENSSRRRARKEAHMVGFVVEGFFGLEVVTFLRQPITLV